MVEDIGRRERKTQLLLRGMADGSVSDRDRILTYGIAEVYQEISLYIEEAEIRKKHLEELKNKNK